MRELAQIYPDRISFSTPKNRSADYVMDKWFQTLSMVPDSVNLSKPKSSINLSQSSKRVLRDSINLMYRLSKPRTIKTPGDKFIYNFRQSFVTLTLPSKQVHTDVEIKQCLNNFFVLLRKSLKIQNYIWRAELQKNGNIHFHLVFDKYIPFAVLRHYWNLSINKLGYVDRYQDKMLGLSFNQYKLKYGLEHNVAVKRYNKGRVDGWSKPNSVDVFSVRTSKDVAFYISKYFSKNDSGENSINDVVLLARYAAFGRVWARSRSLSRVKYKCKLIVHEVRNILTEFRNSKEGVYIKEYDYCDVMYFSFDKLTLKLQHFILRSLTNNASRWGDKYPFPT